MTLPGAEFAPIVVHTHAGQREATPTEVRALVRYKGPWHWNAEGEEVYARRLSVHDADNRRSLCRRATLALGATWTPRAVTEEEAERAYLQYLHGDRCWILAFQDEAGENEVWRWHPTTPGAGHVAYATGALCAAAWGPGRTP